MSGISGEPIETDSSSSLDGETYEPMEHRDYYIEPDSNLYTWSSCGSTFGWQYSGGLFDHYLDAVENARETLAEEYEKDPDRFPVHKFRDNWKDYQTDYWSDDSSSFKGSSLKSENLYVAVRALLDGFTPREVTEMISTNSRQLANHRNSQEQLPSREYMLPVVSDALEYIRQESLSPKTQKSEYLVHQHSAFWELYGENQYDDASLPGIMAPEVQSTELYAAAHALCDGFTEQETFTLLATNSPKMRLLVSQGDDSSVRSQTSTVVKMAVEYLKRENNISISREQLSSESIAAEVADRLFQNFSASAVISGRSLAEPMMTTIGSIRYREEESKAVISVVAEDEAVLFQSARKIYSSWQVDVDKNRLSTQDVEKIYSIPLTVEKVSGHSIFQTIRNKQSIDQLPESTKVVIPTEIGDYEFRIERGRYKLSMSGINPSGDHFFQAFEDEGTVSIFCNRNPVVNSQILLKALHEPKEIDNGNEL